MRVPSTVMYRFTSSNMKVGGHLCGKEGRDRERERERERERLRKILFHKFPFFSCKHPETLVDSFGKNKVTRDPLSLFQMPSFHLSASFRRKE